MSPSTPSPSLYRTRIKICGLTREQDVDAAVAAGADAIGFVLYDKSPRHVSIERARELSLRLPPFVHPVLLFVNASRDEVMRATDRVPGAVLQFHGDETPEYCQEHGGARWIRAIRVKDERSFEQAERFFAWG